MSFIGPDEHILIMDYPEHPLGPTDLAALHGAGIRSVLRNLLWRFTEPERGVYDFSPYDRLVEWAGQAGLKVLLTVSDTVPLWCPSEWYAQGRDGEVHNNWYWYSLFSPWHSAALAYQSEFVARVLERYYPYEHVLCLRGGAHGGECLLPPRPAYYDPAARDAFRALGRTIYWDDLTAFNRAEGTAYPTWDAVEPGHDPHQADEFYTNPARCPVTQLWLRATLTIRWLAEQRPFLAQPAHELWGMLHPCWQDNWSSGNNLTDRLIGVTQDELCPAALSWIDYEHFPQSRRWRERSLAHIARGVELWCGSQYCEGLAQNIDEALADGIRGFITGPLHVYRNGPETAIAPWMLAAIEANLARWQAAK